MGTILTRLLVLVACMAPVVSYALGLGPITMRSSLNQPLLAEIEIHSLQKGDLDGLAVRLASSEDFARVNVERGSFLTRINFKLAYRPDNTPYIKLTTDQAVTEPYLDFLIEARWPRGRALKEYTVLVDPPVLSDEAAAPVQQAQTAPVFSQPEASRSAPPEPNRPRSAPTETFTTPPAEPFEEPESGDTGGGDRFASDLGGVSGPMKYSVKRNDTLWEIALTMRPDRSVSVHQMMIALLRENPNAFIQNNINQLKAGTVLRLEDSASVADISKRDAISEVQRQTLAWREKRSGRVVQQADAGEFGDEGVGADDGFRGEEEDSFAQEERRSGSQLKLTAPGEKGIGSGTADARNKEELQQDIILATEALEANKKESEEIISRVSELEEQLVNMQRLINVKDEELLALQNTLGAGEETEDAENEAAGKAPKGEEESLDKGSLNPLLLGALALLAVLILGWMIMRRRKMQDGFQESILNVGAVNQSASGDDTTLMNPNSGGQSSAMMSDLTMDTIGGADNTEVDPLSEADVYLAYGRHQQAEDIIRQAIEAKPDRLDLHAKLLEVLYAAKNAQAFEQHAHILFDKVGKDETNPYWTDAIAWGRELVPTSALFGSAAAEIMDEEMLGDMSADEADLLDFDFDEDSSGELDDDATLSSSNDMAMDFDVSSLDFELEEEDLNSESQLNSNLYDGSLDFDLNAPDHSDMMENTDTRYNLNAQGSDTEVSLEMDDAMNMSHASVMGGDDTALTLDAHSVDFQDFADNNAMSGSQSSADVVAFDSASVLENDDVDLDVDLNDDIFADVDEVGTKLDLAKAYVDMGDSDGARSILDEVLEEGDASQKQQAEELLQQMG